MAEAFDQEDIFTLIDEDGTEAEFGLLGTTELEGVLYAAMVPLKKAADGTYDVDGEEYVILKQTKDENGEDVMVTVDDDEECDRVADIFEDELFSEIDHDGEVQ